MDDYFIRLFVGTVRTFFALSAPYWLFLVVMRWKEHKQMSENDQKARAPAI